MYGLYRPFIGGVLLLLASARAKYHNLFILGFIAMVGADTCLTYVAFIYGYDVLGSGSGTVVLLELGAIALGFLVPNWLVAYWDNQKEQRKKREEERERERKAKAEQERQRRIADCRNEMAYLHAVSRMNLLPFLWTIDQQPPIHRAFHKCVEEYSGFQTDIDARVQAARREATELGLDCSI